MKNTPWWVYVAIIGGVIVLYLIAALITFFLMKGAKKKCYDEFDKLVPYEKERLELILSIRDTMLKDGRHLPKNLTDACSQDEEYFAKVPFDLKSAKGQNDFLVIYLRKYLKEKNLLKQEKYLEFDKKLEGALFLDPQDKKSPYFNYNKRALRYNSYLGMTLLAIFNNGRHTSAPIF
jgi:hypothetical protein